MSSVAGSGIQDKAGLLHVSDTELSLSSALRLSMVGYLGRSTATDSAAELLSVSRSLSNSIFAVRSKTVLFTGDERTKSKVS